MLFRSVGSAPDNEFRPVPYVPGTAELSWSDTDDDNGRLRTLNLSFTLKGVNPPLQGHVRFQILTDNGRWTDVGSDERPVRLNIEEGNPITASCEWKVALL